MMTNLLCLLVDDDPETLKQLKELLPRQLENCKLEWETCGSFDDALHRLENRRYDLIVTDMASKVPGSSEVDYSGLRTVEMIRGKRFCPIVAYSTRSVPSELYPGEFVLFADKSKDEKPVVECVTLLLKRSIPQIARRLHDELDGIGGAYLWQFLEKNWKDLVKLGYAEPEVVERLIRRRAATRLARMASSEKELDNVAGVEFYIAPKLSGEEYRLGEIVKKKNKDEFFVILTPHCHLTLQPGAKTPRAEFVLTVRTIPALQQLAKVKPKAEKDPTDAVRRLIQPGPQVGKPDGRYWFLPQFLGMPDLYCDFMQLESVPIDKLKSDFQPVAVIDSPFAEALQSRFAAFYSSVGVPNLDAARFHHLLE